MSNSNLAVSVAEKVVAKQSSHAPAVSRRGIRLFVAVIGTLEVALILVTADLSVQLHVSLFTEGTFFTWFSSMQLVLIAAAAFINGYLGACLVRLRLWQPRAIAWWAWAMFAFYLAIDEYFMIHEAVAKYSGRLLGALLGAHLKSSLFDGPLFVVYIIVALVLWMAVRFEYRDDLQARRYLLVSAVFLVFSGVFDLLLTNPLPVVWEDGFKLIGFFFLLSSFLSITLSRLAFLTGTSVPEA